jgi:hypothetical protein
MSGSSVARIVLSDVTTGIAKTTRSTMPLYMDIHSIPDGVTMADVAKAHQADLDTQGDDVSYLRYWVNEEEGTIFCLVEAPSADAAARVHQDAHGLVADEIHEVQEGS